MSDKFNRLTKLTALLSFSGLVLAVISLYQHTVLKYGLQQGKSFCNISASINCDAVNQSKWAEILGLPVAGLGVFFYLSLFIFSLFAARRELVSAHISRGVLAIASILAALFSLYLFIISKFVIGSLCILCLGMYLINILLLFVAWQAAKSEGFWQSIKQTYSAILPGLSSLSLHFWLVLLFLCGFSALALSDFMLVRFILAERQEQEMAGAEEAAFQDWQKAQAVQIPVGAEGALTEDYSRGSPTAPVQIVEFSDFECPACRALYTELEELLSAYSPEQVRFIFHNFPLDRECNQYLQRDIHHNACFAAEFARCAAEQRRFWQAVDMLFNLEALNSDLDSSQIRNEILQASSSIGLDSNAMQECLSSHRHSAKIKEDIELASKLRIQGTPAFWINGKKLEAANPQIIKRIVDSILAGD